MQQLRMNSLAHRGRIRGGLDPTASYIAFSACIVFKKVRKLICEVCVVILAEKQHG